VEDIPEALRGTRNSAQQAAQEGLRQDRAAAAAAHRGRTALRLPGRPLAEAVLGGEQERGGGSGRRALTERWLRLARTKMIGCKFSLSNRLLRILPGTARTCSARPGPACNSAVPWPPSCCGAGQLAGVASAVGGERRSTSASHKTRERAREPRCLRLPTSRCRPITAADTARTASCRQSPRPASGLGALLYGVLHDARHERD
jgi:hypothetical protein